MVLGAHGVRGIVSTIPRPLNEVAVGLRVRGHVVMHFRSCGRQDVIFLCVARVE